MGKKVFSADVIDKLSIIITFKFNFFSKITHFNLKF
jgi:hypothetical protein